MTNPMRLRRPFAFEALAPEAQATALAQFSDAHAGDGMLYVVVGQVVTSRFSPWPQETQDQRTLAPAPRNFHEAPRRWWGDVTKFDHFGGGSAIYYEALVDEVPGSEPARWFAKWVVDEFGSLVEVPNWRGHLGDTSEYLLLGAKRIARARRLMDYWCRRQALAELQEHFAPATVTVQPDGWLFIVAGLESATSVEISPAWLRNRYRCSIDRVLGPGWTGHGRIDGSGHRHRT